jgi:hypothetical protein
VPPCFRFPFSKFSALFAAKADCVSDAPAYNISQAEIDRVLSRWYAVLSEVAISYDISTVFRRLNVAISNDFVQEAGDLYLKFARAKVIVLSGLDL